MTHTHSTHPTDDVRASLSAALTFHASFDHGVDADFALGDKQIATVRSSDQTDLAAPIPGLADPAVSIRNGAGKFGDALAFTSPSSSYVVYKAAQNVAYAPELFRGTASLWLCLDPAEIDGQYADPFQLTDKNFSDACIWIDFTKNDTPSDFRLGVFGDQSAWDVTGQRERSQAFFWRLAKVTEPPFAKDRWTHVVITWDNLNTTQPGRARLYFNAEYQGASGAIREHFSWDVTQASIRLGTGPFVGLFDDIALFNRPLTPAEIEVLYKLDRGIVELHP